MSVVANNGVLSSSKSTLLTHYSNSSSNAFEGGDFAVLIALFNVRVQVMARRLHIDAIQHSGSPGIVRILV